jgi:hypothetical protein
MIVCRLRHIVRVGAALRQPLFGGFHLPRSAPDRPQHRQFDHVGHGCHRAAHQPSLDPPDKGPFGNIAHDVVSVYSQSVCKMTVVPHKRRREKNRDQAQPSSGLRQPCRLISGVQVASIPVSGARLFFLPLFRPASTHRTGLCQAKAPLAHGSRARPFHSHCSGSAAPPLVFSISSSMRPTPLAAAIPD